MSQSSQKCECCGDPADLILVTETDASAPVGTLYCCECSTASGADFDRLPAQPTHLVFRNTLPAFGGDDRPDHSRQQTVEVVVTHGLGSITVVGQSDRFAFEVLAFIREFLADDILSPATHSRVVDALQERVTIKPHGFATGELTSYRVALRTVAALNLTKS